MDPTTLNAIWSKVNRELWAVTAAAGVARGGLIATFVSQASIVPDMPRVLIGIARQHHTWQLIQSSGAFGLNLFGEQHLDWVLRFGATSGRDGDKLAGLNLTSAATGSPLLADAIAWLDCKVETSLDSGDRTIFLAEVLAANVQKEGVPLTANRMVQLATPDQLKELRRQFEQDGQVDAAAIARWRSER